MRTVTSEPGMTWGYLDREVRLPCTEGGRGRARRAGLILSQGFSGHRGRSLGREEDPESSDSLGNHGREVGTYMGGFQVGGALVPVSGQQSRYFPLRTCPFPILTLCGLVESTPPAMGSWSSSGQCDQGASSFPLLGGCGITV